jgi:hypothetical protein
MKKYSIKDGDVIDFMVPMLDNIKKIQIKLNE